MLAERYKRKRYLDGYAIGYAQGYAQGLAEARAERVAEVHRNWSEWNRRRESAEEEGRPFTEPPPDIERASTNGSG